MFDEDMSERQEIEILTVSRELYRAVGEAVFNDTLLRMVLPVEDRVRQEPDRDLVIALLDEYHERVRMGLREPLV